MKELCVRYGKETIYNQNTPIVVDIIILALLCSLVLPG